MRTLGRRAAIGATTVALLAAAAGTSLAAVRAARDERGVVISGTALPRATTEGDRGRAGPAAGDPRRGGATQPKPGGGDTSAATGTSGGPDAGAQPGAGPGRAGSPGAAPPAGSSGGPAAEQGPLDPRTADQVGRVGPDAQPDRPPLPAACPADEPSGALPVRAGPLQAVNYTLPWPGVGPVVVAPQVGAARTAGVPVRIAGSSPGDLASDGSSLTVVAPAPLEYTLVAGEETATGSIRFEPGGLTLPATRQGCRDRPFVVYDVARAVVDGSPLRIVGVVAPPGTVTIDDGGGAARFRSSLPGAHAVILLTATDAGAPGPLVTTTVTVR